MRKYGLLLGLLAGCASPGESFDWDRLAHSITAGANGYSQGLADYHYQQRVRAPQDYEWAWDQFYGHGYQLVWACRGIQTGQFAEESRCAYKTKFDSRWPGYNLTR